MQPIIIASFYKFVTLNNYRDLQISLLDHCCNMGVKGSILLAEEGINGTISGTREEVDSVLTYLKKDDNLVDLTCKETFDDSLDGKKPFYRMRVKLKKEIVKIGIGAVDPERVVGTYVTPTHWNDLIQSPDILLLDVRNDYEIAIGSFEGSINPNTQSFCEFPDYVRKHCDRVRHKKVAMFCTGGIRCEKASSFMLDEGFETVYHLEGGIINYLSSVSVKNSLWRGDCFVFDNRVAIDHTLTRGRYDMCHACRRPIDNQDKQSQYFEEGISCPYCFDTLSDNQRLRFGERQKQIQLAKQRGEVHLGAAPPQRAPSQPPPS